MVDDVELLAAAEADCAEEEEEDEEEDDDDLDVDMTGHCLKRNSSFSLKFSIVPDRTYLSRVRK